MLLCLMKRPTHGHPESGKACSGRAGQEASTWAVGFLVSPSRRLPSRSEPSPRAVRPTATTPVTRETPGVRQGEDRAAARDPEGRAAVPEAPRARVGRRAARVATVPAAAEARARAVTAR